MRKGVAKVIGVIAIVALLLFSLFLPVFGFDYLERIDFSKQTFSCVAQPYGDDGDNVVNITKQIDVSRIREKDMDLTQFKLPMKYSTGYVKTFVFDMSGLTLRTDMDYKFSFTFYQNYLTEQNIIANLYFKDSTGDVFLAELGVLNVPNAYDPTTFSGTLHTPSLSGAYEITLQLLISSKGGTSVAPQRFCFSDFVFELDSPLYGDHYENNTDEIDDLNDRIIAIEGMLPSMDDVNFDDLLKDADVARYNNGFIAVNAIFNRVVGALEISPVIVFCLAIGLCTYLLGRRLSA